MNVTTVTVSLALTGYIVTYLNNVRLENRKSRLKYVSDQIQFLYGPLFSLNHASNRAWKSFRSRCRPGGSFFSDSPPPSEIEKEEWRLWMTEVFMPLNVQMEKVIIENAHLIDSVGMPTPFEELLAHVEAYRTVLKKWEGKDYSQHTSYLDFPDGFTGLVEPTFSALVQKQATMIKAIF